MLSEFENKLVGFIEANKLFGSAGKVLLAVSGGADSIALMHAMVALKAEGVLGVQLHCAHINHNLRGEESDSDEKFVVAEASKLGVAVTVGSVDVRGFAGENKLSIETAARQLRIESLLDMAKANNCGCVVTAHHKDDNAETMVQRLSRGTGFRGLGGIWPVQEFDGIGFVRPLLCVRRKEIIEYLKERELQWREDSTNEQCQYRRNFIRHRLIPQLQEQSESVVEQLSDLSQSARGFYALICRRAEEVWGKLTKCESERVELDLEKFSGEHREVRVELVRRGLGMVGCGERDLTQEHYERVLEICGRNVSGKKIELPGGFLAWCEYGKLVISKGKEGKGERAEQSIELEVPGETKFGNYLVEAAFLEAGDVDVKKFEILDDGIHRNRLD